MINEYILVFIYIFDNMEAYLRPLVLCPLYRTIIRQRKKDFEEIEKVCVCVRVGARVCVRERERERERVISSL